MSKKNIDKLFQEKFNDFSEIPDEKVWSAISDSLDKKKTRKLIPLWWKLGGVAAVLAITLVLINPFEDENNVTPIITNVEKEDSIDKADVNSIPSEEFSKEVDQVAETNYNDEDLNSNSSDNKEVNIGLTQSEEKKSNLISAKNNQVQTSVLATSDSKKSSQNKDNILSGEKKQSLENIDKLNEAVVDANEMNSEENLKIELEKNELNTKLGIENSIDEVVVNAEKEKSEEELVDESKKKSIFDELEKQAEEEEALVENSKNKWSVGANLAPVYFNSFGEGSPIDPAFNTNSKSGEFNMSYGLSIAYDLTDKLSVRTGVNKVDYGYDTNEVEFSASLQGSLSSRLNNVNYSESAENVVIESKSQNNFAFADRSSDVISNDISRNGVIAQEFGYIEVPVELDYALLESRFGVNLIGGVSTLFLTNNSVVLNDSNETIELGEANNLNNLNFSTNVGFGLNYKFTPKIRLNVEPVFKYQLGTFSDTSGSFNPFSVGVYSGLNFKF